MIPFQGDCFYFMKDTEKKLQLIYMLRKEQEENIGRIQKREQILYPHQKFSYVSLENSSCNQWDHYENSEKNSLHRTELKNTELEKNHSLFTRFLVCVALFITYLYMDYYDTTFFDLSTDMVQETFSNDLDLKAFAFVDHFSYTLED